jgi:hypothetical protein
LKELGKREIKKLSMATPAPRKGFYRGSLVGFLLGFSMAAATGYVYLLQEYSKLDQNINKNLTIVHKTATKVKQSHIKLDALEQVTQISHGRISKK